MNKMMILLALATSVSGVAQERNAEIGEPKGKAIVQVFGNFHTGFGSENDNRGFELDRSYLGYEYRLGSGLSVKGVLDIGKSTDVSDYQRIAYVKHAMVSWESGRLALNGGLISTTQFKFQEKFWGYRYIWKSFQDEYKFGSSADLGLSAAYRFANWISADAIVVNGEGYKKIQAGDGLNYGLGVTLTPAEGFHIRLYGGLNESGARHTPGPSKEGSGHTPGPSKEGRNTANLAAFAGYRHERFAVGAEYSYMANTSGVADADLSGYSLYAMVNLPKGISLFVRFDDLYSRSGWNGANDESAAILGAQFKIGKYVKIAPNFRMAMPKADGAKSQYWAYVNCYFGI